MFAALVCRDLRLVHDCARATSSRALSTRVSLLDPCLRRSASGGHGKRTCSRAGAAMPMPMRTLACATSKSDWPCLQSRGTAHAPLDRGGCRQPTGRARVVREEEDPRRLDAAVLPNRLR
eukprot:15439237-Alexandrium_andersonii.AAC.1